MQRDRVVQGVKQQAEWWLGERMKKVSQDRHDTMEVNPFMAPLIYALHGHKNFLDLADFLLGGHFAIGHATGFGKLIDEKILPNVFNTIKLDKKNRKKLIFEMSCFDNIDHVVDKSGEPVLLSLKASKWTIQLGQAVELNKSFKDIKELFMAGKHAHTKVVIATFYGHADKLTDKYRLVQGISTGANHDVHDLQDYVTVLAGQQFWSWLGDHEDTQVWVMEGIHQAIDAKKDELLESQKLLSDFRKSFARRYKAFMKADGTVDWVSVLKAINGD